MFYTVYKITNLVNNKIYIGVHKTSNLEDDYMGSGLLIKNSIKKYGLENFKKEYISIFDNAEDMFNMESELVNEEFINRENTYNIKQGGNGGFDFINNNVNMKSVRQNNMKKCNEVLINKLNDDISFRIRFANLNSEKMKQQHIDGKIISFNGQEFKGKNHSEETKKRIGEANSKHQLGEGNSQFGTMWIHNIELKENKKISKEEEIPKDWLKGRKMKF